MDRYFDLVVSVLAFIPKVSAGRGFESRCRRFAGWKIFGFWRSSRYLTCVCGRPVTSSEAWLAPTSWSESETDCIDTGFLKFPVSSGRCLSEGVKSPVVVIRGGRGRGSDKQPKVLNSKKVWAILPRPLNRRCLWDTGRLLRVISLIASYFKGLGHSVGRFFRVIFRN